MASVQTPVRQPFGVLDSSKLRNLQSIKNRQNAIVPSSAPSLKRRHHALDLSDSENVDPVDFKASLLKRKKTGAEDGLCKPSTFDLRALSHPKPRLSNPSVQKTHGEASINRTAVKPVNTSSARPAAGRFLPKSRRAGILSNRRARLSAPTFGSLDHAPLSLAAAVQGTLAGKKQKRREEAVVLEESKPKSWFFDIYEETAEEEHHVMTEWTISVSADAMHISDDDDDDQTESSFKTKKLTSREEMEKENIPPNELGLAAPAAHVDVPATSRKDMMTDEPRTPLGDLNPSEYYAEGCTAASVVLVAEDGAPEPEKPSSADEKEADSDAGVHKAQIPSSSDFSFNADFSVAAAATEGQEGKEQRVKLMTKTELNDLLLKNTPFMPTPAQCEAIDADLVGRQRQDNNGDGDAGSGPSAEATEAEVDVIEIWESGSAKDEADEMEVRESIFA